MRTTLVRCVAAVILCATFAACSRDASQDDSTRAAAEMNRPLEIITVNYPLAYFAERILGDHGSVSFPAPADVDPAYWSPAPEIISEYQQADLVLLNGAG